MKKRIKDLTDKEAQQLCRSRSSCKNCPLSVKDEDGLSICMKMLWEEKIEINEIKETLKRPIYYDMIYFDEEYKCFSKEPKITKQEVRGLTTKELIDILLELEKAPKVDEKITLYIKGSQ